jgi:two-component sensor histidine kinase
MTLDIATIFITLSIANAFIVAILILFWKTQKTYGGFFLWLVAQTFITVNFVLLLLRGTISDFFSIILANYFFAAAGMFILYGIKRFFGKGANLAPAFVIPPILTAVIAYYCYADRSFTARTMIVAVYTAIIGIAAAREIFRSSPRENKFIFYLPAVFFLSNSAFIVGRAFFIAAGSIPREIFDNRMINSAFFIFIMVMYISTNVMFILWNYSRMSAELEVSNRELTGTLSEKETLLKELNHRTKNNLQIIVSMIRIKRNSVTDTAISDVLCGIETRVQTLSLVYDKLFNSRSISNIPLDEYISELSTLIIDVFKREPAIRLEKNLEHIRFKIDNAVSVGIIINEILSNALKHAFDGGVQGTVSVTLKKAPGGKLLLSVADNGKGIPEGFRPDQSKRYGIHIILTIAENQLRGKAELVCTNGTRWDITFDEDL